MKKKIKRKPNVPKIPINHEEKKYIIIGIAIIILILFIALIISSGRTTGEAQTIGATIPSLETSVDLTTEDSLIFVIPRTINITINITTNLNRTEIANYTFSLYPTSAGYISIIEDDERHTVAQDILNSGDEFDIYLDPSDTLPDLHITFTGTTLTVRNTHYTTAAASVIKMFNASGYEYGPVIRVNDTFTGIINATSLSAPDITVNGNRITQTVVGNTTTVTLNVDLDEKIYPIEIVATVQDQETYAYYTLISGNLMYVLNDTGYPEIEVELHNDSTSEANLTVTFADTEELQPFALPCTVGVDLDEFFADVDVDRVYTYNTQNRQSKVWNSARAGDDFSGFNLFKGYYVKMKKDAVNRTVNVDCEIETLDAYPPMFGGDADTFDLKAGWNLMSIPGTVHRTITDLIEDTTGLRLAVCSTGYTCTVDLPFSTQLDPGKPYWLYTPEDLTVFYSIE